MKRSKIRELTYISLCVAIMAVLSQIAIPTGAVPITLQTFVVALTGYFLGFKNGLIAIITYVLLGLVGVPVFASFQGGLHILIGYTGGFIFGYLPFVALCGINAKRTTRIILGIMGVLVCHMFGVIQYSLLAEINIFASFVAVSLPFLIKDVALVVGAYFVSESLRKKINE